MNKVSNENQQKTKQRRHNDMNRTTICTNCSSSPPPPPAAAAAAAAAAATTKHKNKANKKQRLSPSSSTKIAIIGTGPSGLSAALSLQQAGFQNIQLYERDEHFNARKDGYGLTLTYNPSTTSASAPLAKLGLLEKVARMDCPSRSHYVFNSKGRILGYYGNSFSNSSSISPSAGKGRGCGQRGNLRVPRQCLRKIMMDTLIERDYYDNDDNHNSEEGENEGEQRNDENKGKRKKFVEIHWGKKLVNYCTNYQQRHYQQRNNEVSNIDSCHDYNDNTNSNTNNSNTNSNNKTQLFFEDGSTDTVDLLIGADGVKSVVIQQLLSGPNKQTITTKSDQHTHLNEPSLTKSIVETSSSSSTLSSCKKGKSNSTDLSYIGIMIVLGITKNFFHPLLDERGFYTLDGNHRLFTMPFEGSRISDLEQLDVPLKNSTNTTSMTDTEWTNLKRNRRYMWQLSYKLQSLEEASKLAKSGPQSLLNEVLNRTNGWHQPVEQMIRSTPLETIWGTPLMDREPNAVYQKIINDLKRKGGGGHGCISKIVVLGDSIHSMSPFKGQGCNQALMDGPLLSSWLGKSTIDSAIKGFMREMTQRTHKKVMASRDASILLHSEKILSHKEDFAGVKAESIQLVLEELEKNNIGAHLGLELDSKVFEIVQKLDAFAENPKPTKPSAITITSTHNENQCLALKFAANGDLVGLRNLSIADPVSLQCAKDKLSQETCLHLAAKNGHYHTCKWLLSEACLDIDALDNLLHTALHKAIIGGDRKVTILISKASKMCSKSWSPDLNGQTPIDLAKQHCDGCLISYLKKMAYNIVENQ